MATLKSLLPLLIALPPPAQPLDVLGPTYPISEPHLLQMIEQRLRDAAASGELQRRQVDAVTRARNAVQRPTAVSGVQTTVTPRVFYVDPGFTLQRNILGANGELLYPAGSRHNPLEVVSLSQPLLFFDGRDSRQITLARKLLTQYQGRLKPILTGGAYLDLMKRWQTQLYFDQQGRLTQRLGITQVPALVSQEQQRLKVEELQVRP